MENRCTVATQIIITNTPDNHKSRLPHTTYILEKNRTVHIYTRMVMYFLSSNYPPYRIYRHITESNLSTYPYGPADNLFHSTHVLCFNY